MRDDDLERLIEHLRRAEHPCEWEELAGRARAFCHHRARIACPACGGEGERSYPDTSTWRGGVGGQAFTVGVCDRCWGTGRTDRRGADLRHLQLEMEAARRATFVDHLRRRIHIEGLAHLPVIAAKLERCRWPGDTHLQQTVRLLCRVLCEAARPEADEARAAATKEPT